MKLIILSDNGLRYLAKEMDVDVLIFGHFHHPIIEESEVLLLSPGSAIVPGIAEPSAIEIDIFDGRVRVIRCDGDVCSYFKYGGSEFKKYFTFISLRGFPH